MRASHSAIECVLFYARHVQKSLYSPSFMYVKMNVFRHVQEVHDRERGATEETHYGNAFC